MARQDPDSQSVKRPSWIGELIAAAEEYGGPRGVALDASIRKAGPVAS